MLQSDFFTVVTSSVAGPSFLAKLALNARHRIFGGHFPGQPVVPGVCLMQMVQEVMELALGDGPLRLVRADQMKFIAPIDPGKVVELEMKLNWDRKEDAVVQVTASVSDGERLCFKFSGVFICE